MPAQDLLHTLNDRLGASANARSVYGDPIETHDRTILPVAKIQYGFGGGIGSESGKEGSGGGGAVRARAVGVIEIDSRGTRFVPIIDATALAMCLGTGLMIGLMLRR